MSFTNFIKRPVLSTVVSIFFVLLGIIGLVSLPIEQYPNIAPPTIQVSTTYQGADAQTVLNSVIAPLEESINGVENMTYMTSSASNSGYASITVYFKKWFRPRYGCGQCTEPCISGAVSVACRGYQGGCYSNQATEFQRYHVRSDYRRWPLRRPVCYQLCLDQRHSSVEAYQWCG